MLTKKIWQDFNDDLTNSYMGCYIFSDQSMAKQLLLSILLTPVILLFDILFLPFELISLWSLQIIKKMRSNRY